MKLRTRLLLPALMLFCCFLSFGQETFPRNDVKDERAETYALVNAIIHLNTEETLENGTLLVEKDQILAVGEEITIPAGYQILNLTGKHLYPSFIDVHTHYAMPEVKRPSGGGFSGPEQIEPKTKGPYNANDAIKSYYRAVEDFSPGEKAGEYRKLGFGTVLTFRPDGISRGSSALVTVANGSANEAVLLADAGAHYSFNRGSSAQSYPRSMMGMISLLRQTYLDAEWYSNQMPRPFEDAGLEGWLATQALPQIFEANSWINVLRADKIGDEFDVQYIIKSGGNEYQRIQEIKSSNAALIVPLNFPKAFDVEDPIDAEKVSYEDMLHWELAPTNPAVLEQHGITFAITRDGLAKEEEFEKNLLRAIEHGLSKKTALAALTTVPAKMVGMQDRLGALSQGMVANFLVTDGELFEEKTEILENWIQGDRYILGDIEKVDHTGSYTLEWQDREVAGEITGKPGKEELKIVLPDSSEIKSKITIDDDLISLSYTVEGQLFRLSGWSNETGWSGRGQDQQGTWFDWSLTKKGPLANIQEKEKEGEKEKYDELGQVIYPFMAFGVAELPQAQKYLIKNATVWTNEAEGIVNTDVLVNDGKIIRIDKNLSEDDAIVVDATSKHLTPGIIDEHTHIAGGGNEVLTNSALVRIGDQVNSEDINIYRALAGGVTAAQVLHGSANPIGGQSAIIKMRWGASPEQLKVKGASEFIKFALGENVKRSRNPQSVRYPQTRMGVEQVFVDAFHNARVYEKNWKEFEKQSTTEKKPSKPRRDLTHEAILEILNRERFITCHSYVQSEINMLMKVAEKFDFNINTFTHIMEGYKVADKMKTHGVAGSSFSDWFNYKWEVRYAIPYNAAIMNREGVLTAINSDDANMGRRLNQEAAKSVKYGGLDEEEAFKMVTLNPAKMLHLDDRMGSIKVGKDADLVLWTHHPLSVYARAEKTWVDGALHFDLEDDQQKRKALQENRSRLIQKMLAAKKAGKPTQKAASKTKMLIHCESVMGEEQHSDH